MFTVAGACLIATAGLEAQEIAPVEAEAPTQPRAEHQWLQRLVGEWTSEAKAVIQPGEPPYTCEGTETVRAIGDHWIMAESKSEFMDVPVTGVLTLGYDPKKKKFVGTWIDSMMNHLWLYEGTLDAEANLLTLETRGPSHGDPAKLANYREVLELKSDEHKVFTSSVQGDDGQWTTFVTVDYRRKKPGEGR
ncbi:MAG: DUF1579 domain-containing protein [Planctomycetes bacterium]|nr:DUF1579 domain-containing protein [Planctomycetota bacterium]